MLDVSNRHKNMEGNDHANINDETLMVYKHYAALFTHYCCDIYFTCLTNIGMIIITNSNSH